MNAEYDYLIKLLVIGDSGVGKSSLLLRFADDGFTDSYISTIGVDFKIRTIEIDNKVVKLQIWDTAGQERFRTIVSSYYRGANGVILTYSTTDMDSFSHLDMWRVEIEHYAPEIISIVLCGTKSDDQKHRQVSFDEGKNYSERHNYKFLETSSKSNFNVESIFMEITREVMNKGKITIVSKEKMPLINTKPVEKEKRKCCV
jgi:Ras-related protein Rab-1A